MKCPKCGYLGFERVERCPNCGYDFSLAQPMPPLELPIRSERDHAEHLDDLSLVDAATAGELPLQEPDARADLVRGSVSTPEAGRPSELPLFASPLSENDEPLIARPYAPRAPLSVRRSTPEIPRARREPARTQNLDLALDLDIPRTPDLSVMSHARVSGGWSVPDSPQEEDAAVGARLVAVVIDLLILACIDGVVIYFTMQICELSLPELGVLPKGPLFAFLLVQNGGYLVAFTVGGQTLGKMAVGIRVVTTGSRSSLDLGRAFIRELAWIALAVPAGLGFLTVFTRGRRGLHDRFAGTRVVR